MRIKLIDGVPPGVMLMECSHSPLGQVSYLLIDLESLTAAVFDPHRDVDPYLVEAFELGVRIKHVFLTRLRESSGHLELRDRAMATVYAGAWVRSEPSFMVVKDGDAFEFGRIRLRILETPGRRLESLTILLYDLKTGDPNPFAALTGETVLNGDIGRPEPRSDDGYGVRDLASMLYESLAVKIHSLPDTTRLFPAHAGDLDDFGMPQDTIRTHRWANPGFREMTREEFVDRVSLGMVEESPMAAKSIRLRAGTVDEFLRAQREGAQIVDDRCPADYSVAAMAGSINVASVASFEGWVSGVLDPARPILLISAPGREGVTAARLAEAGFPNVGAYLDGGMEALEDRPSLVRHHRRMSYVGLWSRIMSAKPQLVLDTRGEPEEMAGPQVCAYPLSLEKLRQELAAVPRGPEIIVVDDTPYRSSAAASFLRSRGFESVTEVAGGLALWGLSAATESRRG
jgi:hydroxyacylglutathione hydrolase